MGTELMLEKIPPKNTHSVKARSCVLWEPLGSRVFSFNECNVTHKKTQISNKRVLYSLMSIPCGQSECKIWKDLNFSLQIRAYEKRISLSNVLIYMRVAF